MTRSSRDTTNIFTYKEPKVAGQGTFDEEMTRYKLHMSSQGVVCQNIRHFGGVYMKDKNPPEFDPDGMWYLCLDPEVKLKRGSCIVYSIGLDTVVAMYRSHHKSKKYAKFLMFSLHRGIFGNKCHFLLECTLETIVLYVTRIHNIHVRLAKRRFACINTFSTL